MRLKELILNVITFGWHSYQKLKELETKEVPVVKNDLEEDLKKAIERAEDIKKEYENKAAKLVLVQPYNLSDMFYLQSMNNIINDKAFQFFIYNCQQDIFEMLNNATEDKAVEIMGMSKGYKYLLKALTDVKNAYDAAVNPVENVVEADYV